MSPSGMSQLDCYSCCLDVVAASSVMLLLMRPFLPFAGLVRFTPKTGLVCESGVAVFQGLLQNFLKIVSGELFVSTAGDPGGGLDGLALRDDLQPVHTDVQQALPLVAVKRTWIGSCGISASPHAWVPCRCSRPALSGPCTEVCGTLK
jgi:hypothetical protein